MHLHKALSTCSQTLADLQKLTEGEEQRGKKEGREGNAGVRRGAVKHIRKQRERGQSREHQVPQKGQDKLGR
jgi:hypothetical protein